MYTWSFDKKALKEFKKLDKPIQKRLVTWLDKHIEGTENPRQWGKALEGDMKTYWRYRVGSFRLIVDIIDNEFIVLVLKTGKRNDVYKNK
ncbi:type II toxin-antitoxin system mRNA interferase toxin, RelE/StbE family [Tetragenococcus osmophilus]|uniref:Cytotoxic translational repressor of toxin-antitoxin stability system n=1 Tax=Tetragenococcus osmophilus TaxID=526944 RepID=A0AA38CX48_9ENTE|nr:type II toxin-antitoxin system RelE/ParE family toxin [Tetragenococcus osmophilus]AYW47050.1 type II toxin-antitoxin system mRNA interferase toxin, RelE/StbE family [Tetragenococcus osmophilus]GMA55118.1 cytotoxic translational repressor of toxin-antitoxin stability system [Alicyclobacillus contaminans]GMA71109.1 cytotoxic translational repressor of toxin-antitoxin stability system [Tetragenococcus osmophilus]